MRKHSQLKVELNDVTQPRHRNITFELTSLYNLPFTPYRCNIRATKPSDYQGSVKGDSTQDSARVVIVPSGKSLGDILLLLHICLGRSSRTKYICTSDQREYVFMTNNLTPAQALRQSSGPNYIPLEPSPSYQTIDIYPNHPLSCELPSYYSSIAGPHNL
ncbi:hypothetical protein K7432_016057 [Basidiobolus ranarum]